MHDFEKSDEYCQSGIEIIKSILTNANSVKDKVTGKISEFKQL